jgi:hypothetical protein
VIPSKYKLLNRTIKVTHLSQDLSSERHGDFNRVAGIVRLDGSLPKEALEHTFFHELVHGLLDNSTLPELSENESFVDSVAAVLHQYMQTRKGSFD